MVPLKRRCYASMGPLSTELFHLFVLRFYVFVNLKGTSLTSHKNTMWILIKLCDGVEFDRFKNKCEDYTYDSIYLLMKVVLTSLKIGDIHA